MKLVIGILIAATSLTGIGENSFSDRKPDIDTYDYSFKKSSEFRLTNGDEFEMVDAFEGGRSGMDVTDKNGLSTSMKQYSSEQKINPDDIKNGIVAENSFNDYREDNDSFETATSMYNAGRWEGGITQHASWLDATISQKTKGWWLWEEKYIDKDFYTFDACSVGTMNIKLTNIPSGCDYDVRVFRLDDGPEAHYNTLNFDKYIAYGNKAANQNEEVSLPVKPGTYYICIYSYEDKTFDNDNPYHLYIEEVANLNRSYMTYNIPEGRTNGDIGAIWTSEYKPLGITPISTKNSDSRVEIKNYDTYPYIRHLADKYTDGDYINYAVLYIWDLETRAVISAIAGALVEAVNKNTDWDDEKDSSLNYMISNAGLILSIDGVAISVMSCLEIAAIASASLNLLGLGIAVTSLIVSAIGFAITALGSSDFISTKKDLLASLVSMQQTFSVGKGSTNEEVKILRYRYRFNKKDGKRYLDWSPFYSASDYNFYNEDDIDFQILHSGINGTVRGIEDQDEIKKYLEK